MIYIVTALYHEASPFIKYYDLKKNPRFAKNDVFENAEIRLIITGTGKIQSAIGITSVISQFNDADKVVNVGICGAVEPYINVGDLFLAHEIKDFTSKKRYYPDILFDYDVRGVAVTTFDKPLVAGENTGNPNRLEIVDMEASGFYEAAIRFVSPDKIQLLKIVSDHLEGIRCTPELVEDIFAMNLSKMISIIEHKNLHGVLLTENDIQFLRGLAENLRFTETQKHSFFNMAKSYKIRTKNDFMILQSYFDLEVKHKNEVKEHFETIRSLLFA